MKVNGDSKTTHTAQGGLACPDRYVYVQERLCGQRNTSAN